MRVLPFNKVVIYLIALIILTQWYSCKEKQEYIPYVPVRFTIDLNIANELTSTGYSMLYPYDGYGGVLIYCEYYDAFTPTNSVYHAYDAACTLEVRDTCSVVNEGNNLNATCPCCSSIYTLYDGFPISGEAPYPLKEYNINVLGNKLHISN